MCDCIQKVNEELQKRNANTEIFIPITLSKVTRVCVEAVKVDEKKRGKTMKIFASFCPFCGEEYKTGDKEIAAIAPHNDGEGEDHASAN